MDKLLQNLMNKRLQKSFPGSLQIWKQGNPRHQMFLFHFIPLEGEPQRLREGTHSRPASWVLAVGLRRPHTGPDHSMVHGFYQELCSWRAGPRVPAPGSLHACSLASAALGSGGLRGPHCPQAGLLLLECPLHTGKVGRREAATAEASR